MDIKAGDISTVDLLNVDAVEMDIAKPGWLYGG
jgi:hypothetical protein